MMEEVARCQPNGLAAVHKGADDVGGHEGIADGLAHAGLWDGVFDGNLLIGFARFDSVKPGEGIGDIAPGGCGQPILGSCPERAWFRRRVDASGTVRGCEVRPRECDWAP